MHELSLETGSTHTSIVAHVIKKVNSDYAYYSYKLTKLVKLHTKFTSTLDTRLLICYNELMLALLTHEC